MNITNQINHNECGVCVIKSLVEHYYKKDINFEEILNNANLTSEGLSIYDLEILASKYNLYLDSYECDLDELFNLNKKEYFVVLINENNINHYVIAKLKSSKRIEIYCSINGIYELSKDEFSKIWKGIYIKVNKNTKKLVFNNETNIDWNLINWKYFMLINLLNILVVTISLFGSLFIKKIIDLIVMNQNYQNLLLIITTFTISFIAEMSMTYFINILSFKINYRFYDKLYRKTILILSNKYLNFFKKVDYGYIVNVNEYLYEIANFYNIKINVIIADILLVVAIAILFIIVNINLLFILLLASIVIFIIRIIKVKINKPLLLESEQQQAKMSCNLIKYVNYLKSNRNISLTKRFLNNINENFQTNKQVDKKMMIINSGLNIIEWIVQLMFYISNIIVLLVLLNKKHFSISQMLFLVTLAEMFIKSIKKISTMQYEYNALKINKQIILNIWSVANIEQKDGFCLKNIFSIRYKQLQILNDTLVCGANGIGKSTMLKAIAKLESKSDVMINELDINLYNTQSLLNNTIYMNSDYVFNQEEIYCLLQSNLAEYIAEYVQKLNLTTLEHSELSLGQVQILNFLSLLNYENKLIIIDEGMNHVDKEWKQILLEVIKPILLNKNNFLIIVDHDITQPKNYFTNVITLNEKIS